MTTKPRILVLSGPNLNLLGVREPSVYGQTTLADIHARCGAVADELGMTVDCRQSNHQGELVTWIQETVNGPFAGIVINAAAYTHTSVAIMDALKMTGVPIIEVHISNTFAREEFRHHSFISPIATGVICGCGAEGYTLAVRALAGKYSDSQGER